MNRWFSKEIDTRLRSMKKMFNISKHQENVNQNPNIISLQLNGWVKKPKKKIIADADVPK